MQKGPESDEVQGRPVEQVYKTEGDPGRKATGSVCRSRLLKTDSGHIHQASVGCGGTAQQLNICGAMTF